LIWVLISPEDEGFMIKKLLLTVTVILPLILTPIVASGQGLNPASETERTLLSKSEIIDLMIQVGRMPVQQQNEKIEQLWADETGGQTPRTDFLYSSGFAYLDHYKAQASLARAFEQSRGIVEDLTEAYVWYTVALEHPIGDNATRAKIQASQDHIKQLLVSVYPAPSDYELEDLVKNQKEKIALYLSEIRNK
jgi:hypothetical protein